MLSAGPPGSTAGALREPDVEVSFDDGATWRALRVHGHRGDWHVRVRPDRGAVWVSLRAASADGAGNTVEETIVRAYRLR